MKHCLVFASLTSPSKMILFEKKYQTFDTVFHHQMKHLEVRQKYSVARRFYNSLLGVSSGDETLHLMFDILREQLPAFYEPSRDRPSEKRRSHGTRRIFGRLKNLTGHFVHTDPFNFFCSVQTKLWTAVRLNFRTVKVVPYERNTKHTNFQVENSSAAV